MRNRFRRNVGEEINFWPSFADLMSGFALALVLLMLLSWVHTMVKARTFDAAVHTAAETATIRQRILAVLASETTGMATGEGRRFDLGPNGTIVIREGVLFDVNKWEIKPEGKKILDRWGKAFLAVLDNDELRTYIDAILVEGHTDSTGSPEWNWLLSSRRAIAVVEYLYASVPRLATDYPQYLAAVGYSMYRPASGKSIEAANLTEENRQENRRIEFRLHLSDTEVLESVINSLTGQYKQIGR